MYTKCGDLQNAESVFSLISERGTVSWTSMITAYSQVGNITKARQFFDGMATRNVITWKAMLGHFSCMVDLLGRAGHLVEAKNLIDKMPMKPTAKFGELFLAHVRYMATMSLKNWQRNTCSSWARLILEATCF
ncbi:hypothetical protein ABZP36_003541 [Zizania latifolia]